VFIDRLPIGFGPEVCERGVKLPRREHSRVAIAWTVFVRFVTQDWHPLFGVGSVFLGYHSATYEYDVCAPADKAALGAVFGRPRRCWFLPSETKRCFNSARSNLSGATA
jgi:hypothetical protein